MCVWAVCVWAWVDVCGVLYEVVVAVGLFLVLLTWVALVWEGGAGGV